MDLMLLLNVHLSLKICLPIIFIPLVLSAQVRFPRVQKIGVNQGLSQNSVYSIMQDRQGFLWFGTGDGLNRYDGKTFRIFRKNAEDSSSSSLPGSTINSRIVEDRYDLLWLNTDEGLVMLDLKKEKFFLKNVRINNNIAKSIYPIAVDKHDLLWLLCPGYGLVSLSTRNGKFSFFPYGRIGSLTINSSFCGELVNNQVWIASSVGLLRFDLQNHLFSKVIPDHQFMSIQLLKDGMLAIGSANKFYRFDPDTDALETIAFQQNGNRKNIWRSFEELSGDILYVGSSGGGINKVNVHHAVTNKTTSILPDKMPDLGTDLINCFFSDRSGNLWIGTEGDGLYRIDMKPEKFMKFPDGNSKEENLMVKSLYKDDRGDIWVGTYSKGLYIINPETKEVRKKYFTASGSSSPRPIYLIYKDSSQRVWMNSGNRVGYVDQKKIRFIEYIDLKEPQGFQSNQLEALTITEVSRNHYWIGTNKGVYFIKVNEKGKISKEVLSVKDPFIGGYAYAIGKGRDGSLYVGRVRSGLWNLSLRGKQISVNYNIFPNWGFRDFSFSKKYDLIWMASEAGLICYYPRSRQYRLFGEKDGMSNHLVYGILAENDSSLWLSTNKGINHAVIKFGSEGIIRNIRFTTYTSTYDLQSNEFNSGAFYLAEDGTMIFGGVNGINWFKPSSIVTNHFVPQTILTTFKVNDQVFEKEIATNYLKKVTLPYNENTLSFEFASLEFTNPDANRFAYRLKGFDKGWINSGTVNNVRYPRLPPGDYVFEVKSSNNDYVWNERPYQLRITIHPPFWKTWWFISLLSVLVVAIIVIVTKVLAQRRLKIRISQLEHEQALHDERERIRGEIHDDIGAGLTQITLLGESMRSNVESRFRPRIEEISQTGRRLISSISEIVWNMNPENNTLQQTLGYLREQLNKLLEHSGMNYEFYFPENLPPKKMTSRQQRNILLITKEIVHNSIKHSRASEVQVKIFYYKEVLSFEVKDDGVGMLTESGTYGNGLENIRKRVEEMNGVLSIESGKDKGVCISYTIPLEPTT